MHHTKPSTGTPAVPDGLNPPAGAVKELLAQLENLPAPIAGSVLHHVQRDGANLELNIPAHQITFSALATQWRSGGDEQRPRKQEFDNEEQR